MGLHHGRVGETQIVSRAFLEAMTSPALDGPQAQLSKEERLRMAREEGRCKVDQKIGKPYPGKRNHDGQ